jgi:hypothetical protein
MLGRVRGRLLASVVPTTFKAISVTIGILVPWNEMNQALRFSFDIQDVEGRSLFPEGQNGQVGELRVSRRPHGVPGVSQVVSLAFSLASITFPQYGTYAAVVAIGGEERCRIPLEVVPDVGN